jgi:hypothetical protein
MIITTAVTVHIFHNAPNNKNLKSNSTDILVSQMVMICSYVACEYDGQWWLGIVQRQDHMSYVKFMQPDGLNCNFLWPHRYDCCWIEDNNVLLVIHALRQVEHTKRHQNYYLKHRSKFVLELWMISLMCNTRCCSAELKTLILVKENNFLPGSVLSICRMPTYGI